MGFNSDFVIGSAELFFLVNSILPIGLFPSTVGQLTQESSYVLPLPTSDRGNLDTPKDMRAPRIVTRMDHFNLLEKWAICGELGMSVQQFRECQKLRSDFGRHLYADDGSFLANSLRDKSAMLERGIESMLTETQVHRLWQLAHYVEIAYVGLDGALAYGRLGQLIGVTENQRTALKARAQKILADSDMAIRRVRRENYASALSLLNSTQRDQAIKKTGEYFEYVDPVLIGRKAMIVDSQLDKITDVEQAKAIEKRNRTFLTPPDFNKRENLFKLLQWRSVQDELALTKEQVDAVHRLNDELRQEFAKMDAELSNRSADEFPEDKKATGFEKMRTETYRRIRSEMYARMDARFADALEEVLLPHQMNRVMQLSYYAETEYVGLGAALTHGRLGREIGVSESEYAVLRERIHTLDLGTAKKVQSIRMAAHNSVLQELSAEQRRNAEDALGPYFEYKDVAVLLSREGLRRARSAK